MPEYRREPYLPPPDWSWAAALAIAGLFVALTASASLPMIAANTIVPLVIFLLTRGLVRLMVALRLPLRWRTIGLFVLISTSLVSGAVVGGILGRVVWSALYLVLAFASYLVLRAIQVPLLTLISDAWHTLLPAVLRTIRAIGMLLPLMVVFLLLSVFSSELWQSVGALATWRLGVAVLLVLGVGMIIALSRVQNVVDRIPDPEMHDPAELVTAAFARPPLYEHPELTPFQEPLYEELSWRHVKEMHKQAIKTARERLRWHVVGRLVASALFLGISIGGYLLLLFGLLFTQDVIGVFQSGLDEVGASPQMALVKVTLFLVAFVITYFIVQALTEDKMRQDLFEDLGVDVQNWVRTLMLYDVCVTPGYQVWDTPTLHSDIGIAETEIIVPAGTEDAKAQKACAHAAQALGSPQSIAIVTAYERQESGYYDWDIPGHRWQLICWPHREPDLIPQHTVADDLRHQHALGLECKQTGRPIPNDWFGLRAHDKVLARKLWGADMALNWYHIYSCSGPHNLWLFLRLQAPLDSMEAYQLLAEEVLGAAIESELTDAFLVCVSLYIRDARCRLAHLLWRRQPKGRAFVQDKQSDNDSARLERQRGNVVSS